MSSQIPAGFEDFSSSPESGTPIQKAVHPLFINPSHHVSKLASDLERRTTGPFKYEDRCCDVIGANTMRQFKERIQARIWNSVLPCTLRRKSSCQPFLNALIFRYQNINWQGGTALEIVVNSHFMLPSTECNISCEQELTSYNFGLRRSVCWLKWKIRLEKDNPMVQISHFFPLVFQRMFYGNLIVL